MSTEETLIALLTEIRDQLESVAGSMERLADAADVVTSDDRLGSVARSIERLADAADVVASEEFASPQSEEKWE